MLERTERLRPETSDRSTHLSELTPNSAKIAYVQAATSDSCMNKVNICTLSSRSTMCCAYTYIQCQFCARFGRLLTHTKLIINTAGSHGRQGMGTQHFDTCAVIA